MDIVIYVFRTIHVQREKFSILTIKARDCAAHHKMKPICVTKGLLSCLQCL